MKLEKLGLAAANLIYKHKLGVKILFNLNFN